MQAEQPQVSFVIPAHNEAASIEPTLQMIQGAPPQWPYEVVVVANNCSDNTAEIASKQGARVIEEPIPGYGSALMTGIKAARGGIIITGDADGTYPFHLSNQLVDYYKQNGLDFLNTNRRRRAQQGALNTKSLIGNGLFSIITDCLYRKNSQFYDVLSGMWVFNAQKVRKILFDQYPTQVTGMPLSNHIKLAATHTGLNCGEIEIPYYARAGGESKINAVKDGIRTLGYLVGFRRLHQMNSPLYNPKKSVLQ